MSHVALGGSNTLGAQDVGKPDWWERSRSFSVQLQSHLETRFHLRYHNSAVGGMGPILAASCMTKFVSKDVRVATVEYIPNMGYTEEDSDEVSALERLIRALFLRDAQVFVVNILPGTRRFVNCVGRTRRHGCQTRAHVKDISDRVVGIAARYNVSIVTVDDDFQGELFNRDHMHVNQRGHDRIFAEIAKRLDADRLSRPRRRRDDNSAPIDMGVECMIGKDIARLIKHREGFSRVQLDNRTPPKIGWETRRPNSHLSLCLPLPRSASNSTGVAKRYRLGIGMQVGGARHVPPYGVMRISCHGGCRCKCFKRSDRTVCINQTSHDTMTGSQASVTKFFRYFLTPTTSRARRSSCGRGTCLVRLHSSDDPNRNRLILRSVIVGIDDWHTNWLNEYHQNYAKLGEI